MDVLTVVFCPKLQKDDELVQLHIRESLHPLGVEKPVGVAVGGAGRGSPNKVKFMIVVQTIVHCIAGDYGILGKPELVNLGDFFIVFHGGNGVVFAPSCAVPADPGKKVEDFQA
jgi:hypothetical protein